ncbi:MAG: 30S ribosomal protein S17 [Parcubacteria group bacterium]|nr:30S ribosomal protein S17 [Parcubacteria group bacterium]
MAASDSPLKRRTRDGIIVAAKTPTLLVVEVERLKEHKKYKKQRRVTKRYHVHDPEGRSHVGERVTIEESRPISRSKRWIVVRKGSKDNQVSA